MCFFIEKTQVQKKCLPLQWQFCRDVKPVKLLKIMRTKSKMTTFFLLVALLLLLMFGACQKIFPPDDSFSLQRTDFEGSNLRIDGYFYRLWGPIEDERMSIIFFYENGVLLRLSGLPKSELVTQDFTCDKWIQRFRGHRGNWGLFVVDGDVIKFERWVAGPPRGTFIWEGVILNDTTFLITKSYSSDKSELRERNELWHFRASPKPDSTNIFIP